jgi:hypothetical protein
VIYEPLCKPCQSNDPYTFRRGCEGCTARLARISAEHNKLTPAQVAGADSMFQTLPEKTHD